MTTTHVDAKPPTQPDTLAARTLKNAKALMAARGPQRTLPFRHADLFREAVYADGQPYAADDLDDEDG